MDGSIFDPKQQEKSISGKIVAGLERISEVFKVLLWEKAKREGLSPIQIQILIFVAYHKPDLCSVSHLAREFNVTKPTVSDAVKVLLKKGLVSKDLSSVDSRSYAVALTDSGRKVVSDTDDFAHSLQKELQGFEEEQLNNLFGQLSKLIFQLNKSGILSQQRTCFGCRFYQKQSGSGYCNLLNKKLESQEIRLDCPEFEMAES